MPLSSMYPPFLVNQVEKLEGGVLLVPDAFAVRVVEPTVARLVDEKVLLRPVAMVQAVPQSTGGSAPAQCPKEV